MIQHEIVLLLKKISLQLEQVLRSQDDITDELLTLKKDIGSFQKNTLKDLEEKITSETVLMRDMH